MSAEEARGARRSALPHKRCLGHHELVLREIDGGKLGETGAAAVVNQRG